MALRSLIPSCKLQAQIAVKEIAMQRAARNMIRTLQASFNVGEVRDIQDGIVRCE